MSKHSKPRPQVASSDLTSTGRSFAEAAEPLPGTALAEQQHRGQKRHHGGTGERAGDVSRPERTPLSNREGREVAAGATSAARAGSANTGASGGSAAGSARHGVTLQQRDPPFIFSDSRQNNWFSSQEILLTTQNGRPADPYSSQG